MSNRKVYSASSRPTYTLLVIGALYVADALLVVTTGYGHIPGFHPAQNFGFLFKVYLGYQLCELTRHRYTGRHVLRSAPHLTPANSTQSAKRSR